MSSHRRFFVDPNRISGGEAVIDGSTAHQIAHVLRLKTGDYIALLDGSGTEYEAQIDAVSRNRVTARILRTTNPEAEPKLQLTLAMCLLKGDKIDLVVQKCTELGISRIIAIMSDRAVTRPDPARTHDRLARWRKIATEAAEQAGRSTVPEIYEVIPYADLPDRMREHSLVLLAWEDEHHTSLKDTLAGFGGEGPVMFIVGPEGGLTQEEVDIARKAGAKCVSMGSRTLRSETAAIAGTAMILYELEDKP